MTLARGADARSDRRCYPGSAVMSPQEWMGELDTEENYLNLITKYVREKCRPGQVLKLVSTGRAQ